MSHPSTPEPSPSQRRLLEALVVGVCLVVTIGLALPQLLPALRAIESRATADDVAAFLIGSRREATNRGVCVEVKATPDASGGNRLERFWATGPACSGGKKIGGQEIRVPVVGVDIEGRIAFRSSGYALGRGGRLVLRDKRIAPRRREVRVTPQGRVCVRVPSPPGTDDVNSCVPIRSDRAPPTGNCDQTSGAVPAWFAILGFGLLLRRLGRPRLRRNRGPRRRRRARGYILIEVSIAALVLAAAVGMAAAYVGRVHAAQERQDLMRVATEIAHREADRLALSADLASVQQSEDALDDERRLVRSVEVRRVRPDGAPAPDGSLFEVRVKIKVPTAAGPRSVVARRLVRAR